MKAIDQIKFDQLRSEHAELLEKRAQLMERADAIAAAGESMSAEDSATLAGLVQDVKTLDSRVGAIESELGMESEARSQPPVAPKPNIRPSTPQHLQTRSEASVIGAFLRSGTDVERWDDKQILARHGVRDRERLSLRSSVITSASPGSNLIGKTYLPQMLEELKYHCDWFKIARVIDTPKGNELRLPVEKDSYGSYAVGALIGETIGDTEKNISLSEIAMAAYGLTSGIVTVSLESLQDSEIGIQQLLTDILVRRLARACDYYFSVGTGSAQPQGILDEVGTNGIPAANVVTPTSKTALDLDDLLSMLGKLDPEYQKSKSLYWMCNLATLTHLRKKKDSYGSYLLVDPIDGGYPTILGLPVVLNTNFSDIGAGAVSMVLGDFQKFYIRRVLDFEIVQSKERYWDQRMTAFAGFCRMDSKIADPKAFVAAVHAP